MALLADAAPAADAADPPAVATSAAARSAAIAMNATTPRPDELQMVLI
jgi:hypothetical protein